MKKTWAVFASVVAVVLGVSGLVLAADVPAGKEVIKIDELPGAKGAVEFPHAKHVKENKKQGGAAIVCKDCHHTLKTDTGEGEKIEACISCHVKEGAPKEVGGKKAPLLATMKADKVEINSVIYHQMCKDGCHKAMKTAGKNITACTTCHKS